MQLPRENVLGLLDDYPTRSGYAITPVVAWLDRASELAPNPHEVAAAYRVRLDSIAGGRGGDSFKKAIPESPRLVIGIQVGDHNIHAPTAAMIYQLRELVAGRITRVADLEQPVFAWR